MKRREVLAGLGAGAVAAGLSACAPPGSSPGVANGGGGDRRIALAAGLWASGIHEAMIAAARFSFSGAGPDATRTHDERDADWPQQVFEMAPKEEEPAAEANEEA